MKNLNEIKIFKAAIFLIAAFLLNSCAGRPEIIITADNIEYPLVTGYYLHNKQLKVVGPKDYTIIDPLEITFYRWYIGRQLIPLSSNEIDISEKINEIVKEKGGDAVINFSI